jgi:hypothetical protein
MYSTHSEIELNWHDSSFTFWCGGVVVCGSKCVEVHYSSNEHGCSHDYAYVPVYKIRKKCEELDMIMFLFSNGFLNLNKERKCWDLSKYLIY